MKITLGTIKNYQDAIEQMEAKNIYVSDWAKDILRKVKFSKEKKEVEIKIIKLSDWFTDGYPSTREIYAKAKEQGLTLLDPEVAVYFRLAYTDQPNYNWTIVAHESIEDSDHILRVLGADRYDVFRLFACGGDPVSGWYREDGFAFGAAQVSSTLESQPSDLGLQSLTKRLEAIEETVKKLTKIINV